MIITMTKFFDTNGEVVFYQVSKKEQPSFSVPKKLDMTGSVMMWIIGKCSRSI
jgi:hypothetical protein